VPLRNDSPFNTGLEEIPAPRPTNVWYGPQGGCHDYPRNADGVPVYTTANNTPAPASFRRCPWALGGGQAPMTAGNYRKPAGDHPNAWPAYWEGRWFLADYAGSNNLRHALLMNPGDEFTGGQPDAVDALYGIITTPTATQNNRIIDLDFGPDGALYVADYGGSNFAINNANNSVRRYAYVGGPDTPGPDPQYTRPANQASTTFAFDIGKSGGVSYRWEFSDGGTAEGANVTHTYKSAGNGVNPTAKLIVTYADGQTAEKTIDVPVPTAVPSTVTADVAQTLGLALSGSARFGNFVPGTANNYAASIAANVISTLPNAMLSVADLNTESPGRLVNTGTPLASALRARATNAANPATSFADISGSPLTLLNWSAPVSNDPVTLQFSQPIAANEALKAGQYSKTLTFTLSTTAP
jgi:hypothetical protein